MRRDSYRWKSRRSLPGVRARGRGYGDSPRAEVPLESGGRAVYLSNGILREPNCLPGIGGALLRAGTTRTLRGDGIFTIRNVPAERFNLHWTHVGYHLMTVPNVVIDPDTRKRVRIETETANVKLNEITVVQERPVIHGEIHITTYLIPSRKTASPPIDNPGSVYGGWRPDRRPFRVKSLPAGEHPPFETAAGSPGRGVQRGRGNQPV